MQPSVWECSEHRIHIIHEGIELQFESMDAFLDALSIWQEYALFHKMKFESMPEEFWIAFSEANRN